MFNNVTDALNYLETCDFCDIDGVRLKDKQAFKYIKERVSKSLSKSVPTRLYKNLSQVVDQLELCKFVSSDGIGILSKNVAFLYLKEQAARESGTIESISDIDKETPEGRLCMMLLAEVTTSTHANHSPDETINLITRQYSEMFSDKSE